MTIPLPPELEAQLENEAKTHGLALPDYVLSVLSRTIAKSSHITTAPNKPVAKDDSDEEPFYLRVARRIRESIPPGESANIPSDLGKY